MGENGKQAIYSIIETTAKEAVGDSQGIELQAKNLVSAFSENGILNSQSCDFTVYNCYDSNGKFVGVELSSLQNGILISEVSDTVFKVTTSEMINFADDAKMAELFGYDNYTNFSDLEKLQARHIEYLVRQVSNLDGTPIDNKILGSYLSATGKTIDDLDDIDLAMLKIGENIAGKSTDMSKLMDAVNKYDGIIKAGEKIGGYVDIACTAFIAGRCIYEATEAYENGETNKAIGIVMGEVTDFAVSTVGGWAITGSISPYLIGLGSVIGGPIGGAIGGILSGIIGYGLAGLMGSGLGDIITEAFIKLDRESLLSAREVAAYVDPLILDLNGDGKYTKELENGVHFDFGGDGFAEKTGWVSEEDGLLVRDINNNGEIDDGSEIFGDRTQLSNGQIAENGFQALEDLDSNGDKFINKEDVAWGELKIWQDKNSDGISQEDELYTMSQVGINEIELNTISSEQQENGNIITQVGRVTMVDGTTRSIANLNFDMDTMDTIQKNTIEVSNEIEELPNLIGSGNMLTLHQAMQEDNELMEIVKTFSDCTDGMERISLLQELLKRWADCEDVDSTSRGSNMDASRLAVIECFYGANFIGVDGSDPNANAASILENVYAKLLKDISNELLVQTQLKMSIAMTQLVENHETGEKEIDVSFAKTFFKLQAEKDVLGTQQLVGAYVNYLKNSDVFKEYFSIESIKTSFANDKILLQGIYWNDLQGYYISTDANDALYGSSNADGIFGTGKDNYLSGSYGNDALVGEGGNDNLYGGNEDDTLTGEAGDDYLNGGYGNDTYVYNPGDGQDTIVESSGNDKIIFGSNIASNDLMFAKEGNNLKISVIGQDDNITISNYYCSDSYKVESFQTADGSMLDYTKLDLMIQAMASFEDSTGMMWEEAMQNNNEQANDIMNQWWTKEEV